MQQHRDRGTPQEFGTRGYNFFTDDKQRWPYSIGDNFASSRSEVESMPIDLLNTYLGSQAYESKNDYGQNYLTPGSDRGIASSVAHNTMRDYLMQEARQDQTGSSSDASNVYSYLEPRARDSTGEIRRPQLLAFDLSQVYADLQGALPDPRVSSSIVLPEEPVFVNAKQYHGILRRRQLRAKAELENKVSRVRKPYLHESRHLHALRRARGCGGRFINTKKKGNNTSNNAATSEESNGFGVCSQPKAVSRSDSDHGRGPSGPIGSSMSNYELSLQDKGVEFRWKGFLSE